MIGEFELTKLLEKYGLNVEKVLNINDNILTYGEYKEIDDTLNYLINELKINKAYIEKCPSILYMNVGDIKNNVKFLKEKNIKFSSVESCLHVLSTDSKQLIDTYNYVERNYGTEVINKITSVLAVPKEKIIGIENLNIPNVKKQDIISISIGRNSVDDIKKIINSKEYKEHPELFTPTTLAYSNIEKIQVIIDSKEFEEHPELFTSQVLAQSNIEKIQAIINSKEFKEHPELFTSTVLAQSNIEKIQAIINSKEYKEHPELFTSEVLAQSNIEKIQAIIDSKEYKEHPELFTSQVLAQSNIEKIQAIINSKEFKEHPELFTSTVLAKSNIEKIQAIINSKEFKEHPELFTSEVLAHSNIEDIRLLLNLPYWQEEKYKRLLTSIIVAKSKSMLKKLPILFKMAEEYGIDEYLTTSYLILSPSQNYALINYLIDNEIPLITEDCKLNSIFGKAPNVLKKKYNLDIKELMIKYPYVEKVMVK